MLKTVKNNSKGIILIFHFYLVLYGVYAASSSSGRLVCSYYLSDEIQSPDYQSKDILLGDGLILCGNPSDYCFSFWKSNDDSTFNTSSIENSSEEGVTSIPTKNVKWLARGCFTDAPMCEQDSCISKEKSNNNSYFCCCRGSQCNDNISIKLTPESPSIDTEPIQKMSWLDVIYICFYAVAVIIFLLLIGCAVSKGISSRKFKKSQTSTPPDKCSRSSSIDLNAITFLDAIGQGRYGTVYRAMFNEEIVAVKLVADHNKSVFSDEKYIYSLPLMDHPNLLSYLGGGEMIGPNQNPCLGLVLSYCTKGRLNSFLLENTLDWSTFCHIVISCTRGLGHLHSDIKKGDLMKPCIAHRDFNTRNLLLRDDLTCVVSDLGFAIHTQGPKYFQNGEPYSAEMNSLTEVGTLRYMAPEVLEGAVNLRDCETSLKQIDIYALGLVIWEIASRCHDLYQGMPTPHYALPYQAEVGLHPTFEQMQVLVAKNKARPLFPNVWKDTNPAFRQLKETIEDCWDSDAEARLSAMCVETRLMELPDLWKRYRSSLGLNTISPAGNFSGNGMLVQGKPNGNFIISNELSLPKDKEPPIKTSAFPRHHQPIDTSASEETLETPLPLSPSDEPPILTAAKNHQLEAFRISPLTSLQPHQGVNLCLERNLIKQTKKPSTECLPHFEMNNSNILDPMEIPLHPTTAQMLVNEHLVPLLNDYTTQSQPIELPPPNLAPSSQSSTPYPTVTPIPFVQNEVGNPNCQSKMHNCIWEIERNSYSSSSKGWKKLKNNLSERISSFLHRRKSQKEQQDEEHQGILVTPVSNLSYMEQNFTHSIHPLSYSPEELRNPPNEHSNLSHQRERFNPPPVYTYCTNNTQKCQAIPPHLLTEKHAREGDHFILAMEDSKDYSVSKFTDNSSSLANSESSQEKIKRPTLLQLQADSAPEESTSNLRRKKAKLRNPKQRVKTPCHPLVTRLSLYDDSIMEGRRELKSLDSDLCYSLPLDMDKLDRSSQKDSSYCSSTNSTLESNKSHLRVVSRTCFHSRENSMGGDSSKSLADIPMSETQVHENTKSFKSFTRPILAHV